MVHDAAVHRPIATFNESQGNFIHCRAFVAAAALGLRLVCAGPHRGDGQKKIAATVWRVRDAVKAAVPSYRSYEFLLRCRAAFRGGLCREGGGHGLSLALLHRSIRRHRRRAPHRGGRAARGRPLPEGEGGSARLFLERSALDVDRRVSTANWRGKRDALLSPSS